MKQETKSTDKKKTKSITPKVKSFSKPYSHRRSLMGIDAYDLSDDNIGNDLFLSDSDPNGSYTGITKDGDNRPVQDADDL